jgi:hypothetical protein
MVQPMERADADVTKNADGRGKVSTCSVQELHAHANPGGSK